MASIEDQNIETPEVGELEPVVLSEIPLSILQSRRPRNIYSGMWGIPEIAVAALGALALAAAVLLYVFVVIPSNGELARNRSEADRLDAEAMSARTKYGDITNTQTAVDKLLRSADDFETRFLPAATNGRAALYERINGLIVSNGLSNTTGPDYQPLGTADQGNGNQTDEERGRAKFRSLFPGIYVTMTVEGSYQNLRRFIRDIETGNEFVIISSIELAPSDTVQKKEETGAPPPKAKEGPKPLAAGGKPVTQPTPAKQAGKTHGEVVALRLEMAAYFRRLNFAPSLSPSGQNQ